MKLFRDIYDLACLHKGSETVESLLPRARNREQLCSETDSYYLSNICRRVFRAGLKHAMVDAKWPAFEDVFKHFDVHYCAMLSDDDIDRYMKEKRIIRHLGKLKSIRSNAQFILETSRRLGGFGEYLAGWKACQTIDLWWELKKLGSNLGGSSAAAFLRMVQKDTFLLTRDVVAVLVNQDVIEREPTSKKDLLRAQSAFLQWREESGRDLCEISRIVSFTATV